MGDMKARLEILEGAKERMRAMNFGDPVTNVCAGEGNPRRCGYFVEFCVKSRRNKFGVVHREYHARCTDKKGKFWNAGIETLYGGHLDADRSKELFDPIWEAQYGSNTASG